MQITNIFVGGELNKAEALAASFQDKEVALVAGRGVANELKSHFLELNARRHGGYSVVGFYEEAADQVFGGSSGAPARDHGDAVGVGTTKVGVTLRRFGTSILPGGFLKPKQAMFLAIPNYDFLAVTHGKTPLEFTDLRVVFGRQKDNGGTIGPVGLAASDEGANYGQNHKQFGAVFPGTGEKRVTLKFKRGATKEEKDKVRAKLKAEGKETKPGLAGNVLFWLKRQVFQAEDETVLPGDEQLLAAGVEPVKLYLAEVPGTRFVKGDLSK